MLSRNVLLLAFAAAALHAQGLQTLTAQIQKTPTVDLLLTRGTLYLESGDPRQAISDFDRALERQSVNGHALELRARADTQLGKYEDAITDLSGAIAISPDSAELFLARADAYGACGDKRHAAADREEAKLLSPRQYQDWFAHSLDAAPVAAPVETWTAPPVLMAAKFSPTIKAELPLKAEPVAKVEPVKAVPQPAPAESTATHYQRAKELLNKGKHVEGLAEINLALQAEPKNAIYLNTRGFGYYVAKDYPHAIADFDAALELVPNYLNALHNRSLARRNAGDQAGYDADHERELTLAKKK